MKEFNAEVIREYARRVRLPTALVEKDYVLSVALSLASRLPEARKLVFKGGTALKKVYFPDYRFSGDLDFTVVSNQVVEQEIVFKNAFKNGLARVRGKEIEGVSFLKVLDASLKNAGDAGGLNLVLQYESKIGTTLGKKHVDSIKVDFNFGEVYLAPERRTVVSPKEFSLEEFEVNAMQLKEIICEKIHAIYKRPKPRDLYDFCFLLENGVELDVGLADKKLEPLETTFCLKEFVKHVEKLEPKWATDMKGLLPATPPFDVIANKAIEALKKQLPAGLEAAR